MTENISFKPALVLLKSGCECLLGGKHPKINLGALEGCPPTLESPHCNRAPSSWPLVYALELDPKSTPIHSYCWDLLAYKEDPGGGSLKTTQTWIPSLGPQETHLSSDLQNVGSHLLTSLLTGALGVCPAHLSKAGRRLWTHISFFQILFHCYSTLELRDSCSVTQEALFHIFSLLLLRLGIKCLRGAWVA